MKSELEAIVEELKRLREEGVSYVNVSDQTLQSLKNAAVEDKSREVVSPPEVGSAVAVEIPDKFVPLRQRNLIDCSKRTWTKSRMHQLRADHHWAPCPRFPSLKGIRLNAGKPLGRSL